MKKPERCPHRKLVVHREHIAQLTTHQLSNVRGGSFQDSCGCGSNGNPSCVPIFAE
jgi:natural product precursor